jgi:hypothetical protein
LEVLVAALADGAGSAQRADAGARFHLAHRRGGGRGAPDGAADAKEAAALLRFAAEQARLAVAALAGHEARDVADFASTLLVAVLHAEGGAIGQIGDGAVVARNGGGIWQPILWPDHGEYVNTTRPDF